jgi:hypothetical protein
MTDQNNNGLPDWNELPLPDESAAWQDMERRLDEDRRRRLVAAPPLLYGCALVALVGALATGAYFLFDKTSDDQALKGSAAKTKANNNHQPVAPGITTIENTTGKKANSGNERTGNNEADDYSSPDISIDDNAVETITRRGVKDAVRKAAVVSPATRMKPATTGNFPLRKVRIAYKDNDGTVVYRPVEKDRSEQPERVEKAKTNIVARAAAKDSNDGAAKNNDPAGNETVVNGSLIKAGQKTGNADTVSPRPLLPQGADNTPPLLAKAETLVSDQPAADTASVADTAVAVSPVQKTKAKKEPWKWSAGLTMQRQIRSANQQAYNRSYNGNKGILNDQLPSVYVRAQPGKRWFMQAEFRYAAPRLVPDFSYSRHTVINLDKETSTVTYERLRKTYYHQLPFTFNYYIRKNWSIGAGASYAIFYRAIAEKEVVQVTPSGTQTIALNTMRISGFNDSFLYRSQVLLLLQTEYQWKRLSVGLRYQRDAQPYIKYTMPDGKVVSKNNHALEALVRFRLWENRKRK